jgi:hypothetical protein
VNTYEIYEHPLRGKEAVKRGFSWPACAASFAWAVARQVWVVGGVLLLVAGGLVYLTVELARTEPAFCALLWAMFGAITGSRGGAWHAAAVEARGYRFLGLVPARSGPEALAKVAAVGTDWPAEWNQAPPPMWISLVPRSWQQVVAVAGLTYRAAWRYRLIPVLTVLLLAVVVGLPLLVKHDGTARGLTQIVITYSLGIIIFILGLATLWLACGTMARDIEDCQMQVVAVKPVPRWQIWAGKWVGVMVLNVLLLGASGVAVYALIQVRATRLPAEQQAILRNELLVARGSAREMPVDVEKDVEALMKDRLEGQDATGLDLQQMRKEAREMLKASYQLVPSAYRRRWVLDTGLPFERLQGAPLQIRIKFNSSRVHGSPQPYQTAWEIGPPESNSRQRILKTLTTSTFHELSVEAKQLTPDGKLVVDYLNANEIPMVLDPADCMELLYREAGFGENLFRGLLILLFWLGLLAALGLAAASYLSFPVAAFVALTALTITLSSSTLATVVQEGSLLGGNVAAMSGNITWLDKLVLPVLKGLAIIVNLVLEFSPIDALSTGRAVTWASVFKAFAQVWLLVGGVLTVAGIVLFSRRELATAQGQS